MDKMAYVQRYLSNSMVRLGVDAGIGASIGLGIAGFDKEDDTLGSLAGKAIEGAAVKSAMVEGSILASKVYMNSEHFSKHFGETLTAAGIAKEDLKHLGGPVRSKVIGGAVGAAAGLIYAVANNKDDGIISTMTDMASGAGIALAGMEIYNHFSNKESNLAIKNIDDSVAREVLKQDQKNTNKEAKEVLTKEAEEEATRVAQMVDKHKQGTTGDLTKADLERIENEAKKSLRTERRMKSWKSKGKIAGVLGLSAFAVASVLDTGDTLDEQKSTSHMTAEQERKLKHKQHKERKNKEQYAYGYTDMGSVMNELFESRIGHYKMGNSKFDAPGASPYPQYMRS